MYMNEVVVDGVMCLTDYSSTPLLSSICIRKCFVRLLFCENAFSHKVHWNGLTPVCIRW